MDRCGVSVMEKETSEIALKQQHHQMRASTCPGCDFYEEERTGALAPADSALYMQISPFAGLKPQSPFL
ncbi:unnamed protein product [Protopolystoma xenopodis]|uniref:Uncharacterized protein n=1 Tax=Protopolystoma xenopodis TaxID=117903 RepID=A0A448XR62_9PLAT|nr:unnamed protein product [Protopolystoma xenopodis]